MYKIVFVCLVFFSCNAFAQIDSTDVLDYSNFGDAEGVIDRIIKKKTVDDKLQSISAVDMTKMIEEEDKVLLLLLLEEEEEPELAPPLGFLK